MKAARWFGPRDIRVVDVPAPAPRAHEALVRVESVGICGSDIHYYLEGRIGEQVVIPPLTLGHEYAGIVEAVGAEADPALLGRRVAVEPGIPCLRCEWCRTGHYNVCRNMFFPGGPGCDGALCEYMAVHAAFCFPVPEGMTAQAAALIEPAAVAVHAVELAGIRPGETAAILGLGPIGLLTAQTARLSGARWLCGTDLHEYRVQAGARYGLDAGLRADREAPGTGGETTVAWVMDATGGRGVDVAFDCTNSSEGPALACRVTRPGGRCVLTGISGAETDPLPVSVARRRELTVHWCRRFRHNFPATIAWTASGQLDAASLITHAFPLDGAREAFDVVAETRDNVLKVSVDL
jgi:L-iditol 2-dehydrogenase